MLKNGSYLKFLNFTTLVFFFRVNSSIFLIPFFAVGSVIRILSTWIAYTWESCGYFWLFRWLCALWCHSVFVTSEVRLVLSMLNYHQYPHLSVHTNPVFCLFLAFKMISYQEYPPPLTPPLIFWPCGPVSHWPTDLRAFPLTLDSRPWPFLFFNCEGGLLSNETAHVLLFLTRCDTQNSWLLHFHSLLQS